MSNPQIENGYTRIANELLEAFYRFEFSKCEYKIILAVIRKTYGYHKKVEAIGNTELALMTGIERTNVARSIRLLINKNVLVRNTGTYRHTIGINKNYELWGLDKTVAMGDHRFDEAVIMSDHSLDGSVIIGDYNLDGSVIKTGDFGNTSVITGDTPSMIKFRRFFSKSVITDDTYKRKEKESEKIPLPPRFYSVLPREENQNECSGGDFEKLQSEEKKSNDDVALIYPRSLCKLEQTTAAELLQSCGDDAQAVLDVLAAALKADKVKTSPLALLGGLVRRYGAGTFDPIPGLKIKIDREKTHQKPPEVKVQKPVDKEAGKRNIAILRTTLGIR